jgi:hypothetical protein
MRAREFISEVDRRGFLRGAGAAAAVAAAPGLAKAGQYQDYETVKKDIGTWIPRAKELQQRSNEMLSKLIRAAGPNWAEQLKGSTVKVQSNDQYIQSSAANRNVSIDFTVFWDAPDDILAFAIGHELGHIALGHVGDAPSPEQSRKDEMDADDFGVRLCKMLGYNKAGLFKFLHSKKEDYDWMNIQTSVPNSSHPSMTQRSNKAKQQGFELSKGGAQQMNILATHLA